MSAVDDAGSPLYLRWNEVGSGCTRGRPQPLLAAESDADGRAAVVTQRRRTLSTRAEWSRRTRESDRRPAGRNQIIQVALLAVIASFVVATVTGVRAHHGSWWMDAVLQSLAYGAVAVLCFVRTPPSSCGRVAWRFVAVGVLSFGLANVDRHMWLVRTPDPLPVATICHVLWAVYYICVFIVLVQLMQSRADRLPVSLRLGGTATMAALLAAPVLGGSFAQTAAIAFVYPWTDLLLLGFVLGAMSSFRWRPPPSLWFLAGSLLVFGSADYIYAIQAARGSYQPGGLVDAAWMVAITALALAPGWQDRPWIARVPAAWLPLAASLVAAAAAISVLVAASYAQISTVAVYLAVATLLAALGRQATAFSQARRAGEQAQLSADR